MERREKKSVSVCSERGGERGRWSQRRLRGAERVLNGCCHVCVCSRGVGERGVAEAVANGKKKCVARR